MHSMKFKKAAKVFYIYFFIWLFNINKLLSHPFELYLYDKGKQTITWSFGSHCAARYFVHHSVGFCETNVFRICQRVDWGENLWRKYLQHVCLQKRRESTCRAEWGGERNDNMLAAGFVETFWLFAVTLSDKKKQIRWTLLFS